MKFTLTTLILASFVPLAMAQEIKPVEAVVPAAMKPWNGVWKPESCVFNGQQQLIGNAKDTIRLSIVGDQYRIFVVVDPKEMTGKRVSTATLTLDEKTKTFELDIKDGIRKQEKIHGIYEHKGEQLHLCYGPSTKARPEKFEAPPGSEVFHEVWIREKK